MAPTPRIVTLLTDFGLRDHYVAAMKGVMLGVNSHLSFVDITHLIPPQDIQSAAFRLGQAYPCFPARTIHLAVVDPGVGTARKAIIASAAGQFFVAPDNGILSWVFHCEEEVDLWEITAEHYFRKPVSATFHGRDIFAPVAAWISRDIPLHQFGPAYRTPVRLNFPPLKRVDNAFMEAAVLAVDGFGNLVTNLRPEDIPPCGPPGSWPCRIFAAQREISSFHNAFEEGEAGEIFVIRGSSGYLEIVMRNGSAASALGLSPGSSIRVALG
jgi:S-adenosyl-L-methionine hydrolase (adenosine-forming)